jgi:hypothetical protein
MSLETSILAEPERFFDSLPTL